MKIIFFLMIKIITSNDQCIKAKIDIPYQAEIQKNMIEGKDINDFINRKAKRYIRKGECLTDSNTQIKYFINSGQKIKVYFRLNGIKISFNAIALTSANKGEKIKLFNKSTSKVIVGYIKENGEVEISEGDT